MAFSPSVRIRLLSLWLGLSSMNDSGSRAQELQVQQPQGTMSVVVGETLTLTCSVTGAAPVGPVKWLKGSGSDRQLVYAQTRSFPRVTRAEIGSETDFTIRISDTRPADAGVYRCVKFEKVSEGEDKEYKSGTGTTVSVSGSSLVSPETAAVGTVCVLVVLLLASVYFYVRKKRGGSPCTARSQAPFPDNMRTQPQVRYAEETNNVRTQPQASYEKDPDILYADLQHSGRRQKPQENTPEERSEYAAIKVPESIAK